MKTIKQYLQELPDCRTKERALQNMWNDYAGEWSPGLAAAIKRAFLWHRTPEGYEYWKAVHQAIENFLLDHV